MYNIDEHQPPRFEIQMTAAAAAAEAEAETIALYIQQASALEQMQ